MRAKRVVTVPLQPYFGFHWKWHLFFQSTPKRGCEKIVEKCRNCFDTFRRFSTFVPCARIVEKNRNCLSKSAKWWFFVADDLEFLGPGFRTSWQSSVRPKTLLRCLAKWSRKKAWRVPTEHLSPLNGILGPENPIRNVQIRNLAVLESWHFSAIFDVFDVAPFRWPRKSGCAITLVMFPSETFPYLCEDALVFQATTHFNLQLCPW